MTEQQVETQQLSDQVTELSEQIAEKNLYRMLDSYMPIGSIERFSRDKQEIPWLIIYVLKKYVVFSDEKHWKIKELRCLKRELISYLKTALVRTRSDGIFECTESLRVALVNRLEVMSYSDMSCAQLVEMVLREIANFYFNKFVDKDRMIADLEDIPF